MSKNWDLEIAQRDDSYLQGSTHRLTPVGGV